jgi:photosystem II stability/assembly factor-like uncharacterized protein
MKLLMVMLLAATPQMEVVSRLFAATATGPFITYSWGEHWTKLRPNRRGLSGEIDLFLCLDPAVDAGGSDGVFVSNDFGETFFSLGNWYYGTARSLLSARLFALEPTLFVGTETGLYRSTNGGDEWSRVGEGALDASVNALVWPRPELFVVTDDGLFRSLEGGDVWKRLDKGLPEGPLHSIAGAQFFALEPTIFVGTRDKGIYRRRDGGESFEPVGGQASGGADVRALVWWNTLLLAGTDRGLFLSNDGGDRFRETWAVKGVEVLALNVPGAEVGIASNVFVGTRQDVFKSSDGGVSFRLVSEGLWAGPR